MQRNTVQNYISGKSMATFCKLTDSGFDPRFLCQKAGTSTNCPPKISVYLIKILSKQMMICHELLMLCGALVEKHSNYNFLTSRKIKNKLTTENKVNLNFLEIVFSIQTQGSNIIATRSTNPTLLQR